MQKSILPGRRKNSGKKSNIFQFKILAKKPFQNKLQIKNFLKEEKAIIYYGNVVKNQVMQLKKR